jgi:histidyl-tRNA synthetase
MKPSIPKGTRDFSSSEVFLRSFVKEKIKSSFELFGFEPIETPSFEKLEVLTGKYGNDGEQLIFKILSNGEKLSKADFDSLDIKNYSSFADSISEKALRYDLTVPFSRYVVQHQNELSFPFKRYQIQNVWRADRPQHGRFQEFLQCDADIVGSNSLWQEIELCMLYDRIIKDLGLKGVLLRVNNRKILYGLSKLLGFENRFNEFTIILDKLDKINIEGVKSELIKQNFSGHKIDILEEFIVLEGSNNFKLEKIKNAFKDSDINLEGIDEQNFIIENIQKIGGLESIDLKFDLSLARGLSYYTGTIFELVIPNFPEIGSIGGGGRYDNLTENFGKKNLSGVGISIGFERVIMALDKYKLFPKEINHQVQILILNFGNNTALICNSILKKIRDLGIKSEFYPDNAKLKKQLSYANTKKIKYVVLLGDEEFKNEEFILKNMNKGTQENYKISQIDSVILSKLKKTN